MADKRILVIYYSLDGNTRFIAEQISEGLEADIAAIEPIHEYRQKGFMKYFWGGKQVFFKEKPKLLPLAVNLKDYDVIVLGTPVWNSSMTPPMRSLMSDLSFFNKKLILFCCYAGKEGRTFEEMIALAPGAELIGQKSFLDPLRMSEQAAGDICRQWCQELLPLLGFPR